MTVTYHHDVVQGSAAWLKLRCGKLTASEMKFIVTPATLKAASNDKERSHFYEILSQRISGYTEDGYTADDMYRGHEDEIDAKIAYSKRYGHVEDCGFITNDRWGFTIGYSPDGLVGDKGLIETKSRKHKLQAETILKFVAADVVPTEFMVQVQTGLLVAEDREWLDFNSFSAGLYMATVRVYRDPKVQTAIVEVASAFEERLSKARFEFDQILKSDARLLPTQRRIEREITI